MWKCWQKRDCFQVWCFQKVVIFHNTMQNRWQSWQSDKLRWINKFCPICSTRCFRWGLSRSNNACYACWFWRNFELFDDFQVKDEFDNYTAEEEGNDLSMKKIFFITLNKFDVYLDVATLLVDECCSRWFNLFSYNFSSSHFWAKK